MRIDGIVSKYKPTLREQMTRIFTNTSRRIEEAVETPHSQMATKKKRKKEKKRISKIEFSNEPAGPRLWVEGSSFDAELYSPQEIWVGSGAIKKNTLCHMAKSWEWFIIKKKKDRKSEERSTLLRVPPSISYITACHICPWNHETMKPCVLYLIMLFQSTSDFFCHDGDIVCWRFFSAFSTKMYA